MPDAQTTEDRICCYLADHPASLRNTIAASLGIDPVTALRGLVSLQKQNRVRSEGKTKGTRYSLYDPEADIASEASGTVCTTEKGAA